MNSINFNNISMPVLCGCDLCAASEAFYHADRIIPFNVLIYVIEGVIYVTEDGTDYEITDGELLFLKNGLHHFGKKPIPKGTRWYFIHFFFNEEELPRFIPDSSPFVQYEPVKLSAAVPKKLSALKGSSIEKSISSLIDYFHSSETMKKWNINLKLYQLLEEIAFFNISTDIPIADRICRYLNDNSRTPFSAKALEQKFYLSYKHMAAVFKKAKGLSMQQYHTEIRMNEAARLLRSTFMSVGEISAAVGYSDMLYFSRCFRKYSGMSPTEYRKSGFDF